ncbi:hypothetical protein [Paractinoplanes hotanensis]|uniref:Alcohol dehydrogenase n=1 Tax=Paractinoplanes hotanensis TaxID=2906497 RepID=A0ABT0XZR2_9ACTN|nr:hypothetical protein [Actinoplanes hotanensis]MCM4079271.1 hypothetical protein [Actinoplanes hotanensis]
MKAAVVTAYGTAPRCLEFPDPQPTGENEIVVDVLAAGLHPRVRMTGAAMAAAIPAVAAAIADGAYSVEPDPVPMHDVERAWSLPAGGSRRIVLNRL